MNFNRVFDLDLFSVLFLNTKGRQCTRPLNTAMKLNDCEKIDGKAYHEITLELRMFLHISQVHSVYRLFPLETKATRNLLIKTETGNRLADAECV